MTNHPFARRTAGALAASARPALAAALSLVLFGCATVPQSPAGGDAPADTGSQAAYREPVSHQQPTIPIFFGESYEGRLSAENGYNEQYWSDGYFSRGQLKPFYSAAFEIDLLKGDRVGYGVWTDSEAGVGVYFMREETDRKGRKVWKRVGHGGIGSGHSARYRCVTAIEAKDDGPHRIEIQAFNPEEEANYRFFILPRAIAASCDDDLDPATLAYFDRPGQPASLAIAESWVGRTYLPAVAVPPVFGPASTADAAAYAQGKPEALRPYYQALYVDGEHNAVLNFERLGLAAMELGAWDEAEWAFDEALRRIEAVYGRNAIADAARSKWIEEGIKDFKGEPYERAMAYYYRGLLYLRAGDYENARATFMGGEFQDTLSEAEQFQSDFALLNFLAGWSSHCLGSADAAAEAFAIARRFNPQIPEVGAADTLVLADLGRGPVKMARGQQRKLLTFADPLDAGRDEQATVTVRPGRGAASTLPLQEYTNVFFQATTRGGRAFDAILDGKAQLKSGLGGTAEVGYLLTQTGIPVVQAVGAVVMLATGLTAKEVKPDADVRVWDTLPHRVSAGVVRAPGSATYAFAFQGASLEAATAEPLMQARSGRCGIAWSRSRSVFDAGAGAPGNDADIVKARLKNKEAVALDAAFRAALLERDVAGL